MGLEFQEDAICLSGETGTKLKSEIISKYYPFWWNIVSGGISRNHRYPTAIIELDAATGEVYIEETDETVLGSAGHALELKCHDLKKTSKLRIVLVENHNECFNHLQNVIKRRFPKLPKNITTSTYAQMQHKITLLNTDLDAALKSIENWHLGNALYFFDPLLNVEWKTIDKVAQYRIKSPFKTGTEFIIFLFTSDWFLGRPNFDALPESTNEDDWSISQKETIVMADKLFGTRDWRPMILHEGSIEQKQEKMIEFYRKRLLKWFRYVLPLPFTPKSNQLYHLIFCSNYETGIRATRNFYNNVTDIAYSSPDNYLAYTQFKQHHPEKILGLKGNQRPNEWKLLWTIIRNHEGGICDIECKDLIKVIRNPDKRLGGINWLHNKNYLRELDDTLWAWPDSQTFTRFEINWSSVKTQLGVDPPQPLTPIQKISNI